MSDRNIFLSIIENDDDEIMHPETLFAYNSKLLFPDINLDEVYPEIELFVETLESFYQDTRVFLAQEAPYSIGANLQDKSEELVLGVSRVEGIGEMPWYLVTQLGTFYLEFLSEKNHAYVEHRETILTEDMKHNMFLVPCEFEFYSDSSGGEIIHIYDPEMPFPPQKPEQYIAGSKLEAWAKEYWHIQAIKEVVHETAESVYSSDDEPFVELIDAKDGSITRLYGDPDAIFAEAREMQLNGEISGFRFYNSEEETYPEEEDDGLDLIDEILGYDDEDEDDEDDFEGWVGASDRESDAWYNSPKIETVHYVIRPA